MGHWIANRCVHFRVVPRVDHGWSVRRHGGRIAARGDYDTKTEAIVDAQRLARRHRESRVTVYARDFTLESTWTWRKPAHAGRRGEELQR